MVRKIIIWMTIAASFGVLAGSVWAVPGINRKINFQGKVVNSDGTNVTDGDYDVTFKLWDSMSAGTSLWTEVWNTGTTQVAVVSGIFSVDLGTYATFPLAVDFNSDSIYLSIDVAGDGEMIPRIRFSAVPYAMNAEKVGGLTVTNTTGTLTVADGQTLIFGGSFATTGVGISLDQSLRTSDAVTFAGLSIGGTVSFTGVAVGTGTTVLYIGAGGNIVAGTLPTGGSYTATNGLSLNVTAIGLGGTLTQATKINTSTFGLSILGVNDNTQAIYVASSGKVGVGTTNPVYKLEVNGDALVGIKLGVGATGTKSFNVSADANIGTNLSIGGSLSLTGLPIAVGSTILFIDGSGNITAGTMPNIANSKVIIVSPEYPGAVLSADGSGNTNGAMTSENSLNVGGVGWKNFYEWTSAQASLQDYTVVVRITLPSDFDTWETGACPGSTCALQFYYQTGVAGTTNNAVSFKVTNDADTPGSEVCTVAAVSNTAWTGVGCTEGTLNDGSAPEWDAAGETAVVRIKLAANNTASALARSGDIILRYKSKF